ncbi:hypothetical protein EV356DRAFT_503265, partial [Viridothelium virens]
MRAQSLASALPIVSIPLTHAIFSLSLQGERYGARVLHADPSKLETTAKTERRSFGTEEEGKHYRSLWVEKQRKDIMIDHTIEQVLEKCDIRPWSRSILASFRERGLVLELDVL